MSQIVDEYCSIKGSVLNANSVTYSCTLNQTDIASNSNKFYIMQVIQSGSQLHLYTRYGRTGEVGTSATKPFVNERDVTFAFTKQFKAKTGNTFGQPFTKKDGKYFMSDISYDDEIKNVAKSTIPPSKLDIRTQWLLEMLSDVNMMKQSLVTLDIDTKKLPLGKIKKEQLDNANDVLTKIQSVIDDVNGDKTILTKLSSDYYTYLPMAFGRKKPPVIDSNELINKYKDIVTELQNIVVTVKITNDVKHDTNPLDHLFANIKTTIEPLDKMCEMYKEIEKYVINGHGSTHNYKLKLLDVFAVEQSGKRDIFDNQYHNVGNRHLLFHGSGMTNWISILKNDLMLNPQAINKNIMITGKMFGNGIYFADCITKSFGYCRTETSGGIACLALAEIPLGKVSKKSDADYYVTHSSLKSQGFDSVQGCGQYTPSGSAMIDGVAIPNGPLLNNNKYRSLYYNEYIVYKSEQQFIRYLVLVQNTK